MKQKYPNLFSPLEIRGKKVKNRIFFAPTTTGLCNENGSMNDDNLAWIIARAKAGAGMIVSEVIRCTERFGTEFDRVLSVADNRKKEGFRKYAEYSKNWGSLAIAQLAPGLGKQSMADPFYGDYVSPSTRPPMSIPVGTACNGLKPFEGYVYPDARELTTEECDQLIEEYKAAVQRLVACGFDGIEIHGAHGYLLSEFITSLHNHRTDKYGGSFEKRLTLPLAILKASREVAGDNFIVGFRMNSSDKAEGGYGVEEYGKCAQIFQENGADYISLSKAGVWNLKVMYPNNEGSMVEEHSQIKKLLKVPVLSPNICSPELAEKVLAEGKLDMVGLSRGLIADPNWVTKVENGKSDTIIRCDHCNTCLATIFSNFSIRCASNPAAGSERFDPENWPPPQIKTQKV